MIDDMDMDVADFAASKALYGAALATLCASLTGDLTGGHNVYAVRQRLEPVP